MKKDYEAVGKNAAKIFRDNCLKEIRNFRQSGYGVVLVEAAHYYALYRDYSLRFDIPYDEWKVLWLIE